MNIERLSKYALLLAAIGFIGMGLQGLFTPLAFFGRLGSESLAVSTVSEIRTVYGGFMNGNALMFAYVAFFRKELYRFTLSLIAVISTGLLLGRIVSLIADGMPNALTWVFIVIELAAFVISTGLAVLGKREAKVELN
ncbi:MAG: hypothetical protein ETSY2_46150 [Candidatus Entotheonella gemina]|uniref:DUF4345 domain-containing protein n=1 Tax=Candidatus Entotheonella gemina TaxID=1429439 RepID=W4LFR4_9BACT|nr:MAG: hypothetical protein ETSY2_46150 [Candidatus Entotheonella gemina]